MDKSTFLLSLTELLELDHALTGTEQLENLDAWDSLAVIGFIAMVDEECGVTVNPQDIKSAILIDDLYKLATVVSAE